MFNELGLTLNIFKRVSVWTLTCQKKLKRAGISQSDLIYYYGAVIRRVMEYACPVWHSSLTSEQSKALEAVQRRACQIIVGVVHIVKTVKFLIGR